MLGMNFSKQRKAQHGSVMLEVIAVLALMGVMGSMLFRQIYQRNQELHNIQMASEIRTVKEAFTAYIQAYRADLLTKCSTHFQSGQYGNCGEVDDYLAVADYLPSGWLEGGDLKDFYKLRLVTYQQQDLSQRKIVLGFVIPTTNTLPQTGWNFKRAARVALLIGADGGVYQQAVTGEEVSGALGTWNINVSPYFVSDVDAENPYYMAMTGLDVFTPEYELPAVDVNLPETWSLALQDLGAWNYFSVGGTQADCYSIDHHRAPAGGSVGTDTVNRISNNCQPLFYVDASGTGKVFVNHDLEIGSNGTTNLLLSEEGVIRQKDGLTIDKDGRLIANNTVGRAIGDLTTSDRYVVDPAYTSTMNDIRLASRGGVRLSDILPNHILKTQQSIAGNGTITIPTCPTGYTKALVVLPVSWDQTLTKDGATITTESFEVTVPAANIKTESLIEANTELVNPTDGKVKTNTTISGSGTAAAKGKADLTKLKVTEGVCVTITKDTTSETGLKSEGATDTGTWNVTLGYKNNATTGNCAANTTVSAIVQTYCVAPDLSGVPDKDNEASCEGAGFRWDTTKGCVYQYVSCATIDTGNNNGTNIDDNKPAICKAAGCRWDGMNCSN